MQKLAKIIGCLVLLIVVAVLALPLWIGPVVTGVANTYAPRLLGTDFKLDAFVLNPYTGHIQLNGLRIGNPKGFDEPTAVSVDQFSTDLSLGSLATDCINIHDISIENPFVSYVYDANGNNNFDVILANLSGGAEKTQKAETTEEKSSFNKRFRIARIAISGTRVKYRMITLPVPVPTITNIGTDNPEGASFEDVWQAVWNSIKGTFDSAGSLLGSGLQALTNSTSTFIQKSSNATERVTADSIKVIDTVQDGTQKAVEHVQEGTKTAVEGIKKLGNLFK